MLEIKGSIFNQRPQASDAITSKQIFRYTVQKDNVTELDRIHSTTHMPFCITILRHL